MSHVTYDVNFDRDSHILKSRPLESTSQHIPKSEEVYEYAREIASSSLVNPLFIILSNFVRKHDSSTNKINPSYTSKQHSRFKSQERIVALEKVVKDSEWGKVCINLFNHLANHSPNLLCDIIAYYPMHDVDLADAAYALEPTETNRRVEIVLVGLLEHPKPYVREAAVHALSSKVDSTYVRSGLEAALKRESIQELKDDISYLL
ncbi:HEAT repeat domain-containing protein [Deinococcus caeni]|uniref:HEAT repeat domain-containing protein n=1 Tax=Deinococcus caeni TaxID=569127 RepID=UPI0031ED844C